MTQQQFARLVRNVTYKPRWRLWTSRVGDDTQLTVAGNVPDSSGTGMFEAFRTGYLTSEELAVLDVKDALRFVRRTIMALETHEVGEWIKHKDRRPFDPHKRVWG